MTYRYDQLAPSRPEVEICIPVAHTGGPTAELVWAEPLADNCYRLLNVPVFDTGLGLHDVVLAVTIDDHPEVVELVERRTFVRFTFTMDDSLSAQHRELLGQLGAAVERCPCCDTYVANLPHRRQAARLQRFLEQHAATFERVDHEGARTAGRA